MSAGTPAAAPAEALRAEALAEARRWIGTPYLNQAARRGVGCDCLGLIRGIWRALYGTEPETPPPYDPDWGAAPGRRGEPLFEAAARHLVRLELGDAAPGDVLLFRMRAQGPAKHLGVLSAGGLRMKAPPPPTPFPPSTPFPFPPLTSPLTSPPPAPRRAPSSIFMIHAWSGHTVAEVPLDFGLRRRLAACFRFPPRAAASGPRDLEGA